MAGGRPTDYSAEIAEAICALITEGVSVRQIGARPDMPDEATVYRWIAAHDEFRERYARAKEAQADRFAEEIIEIADDGTNDWMLREQGEETVEVVNHEHIQRSKLRVDARKWLMAKMAPKRYGESVAMTGAGGGPILIVTGVDRGDAG